jgi:hypothetical protein
MEMKRLDAHHGSEAFLPCGIPDLEADFGAINGSLFRIEEGTSGGGSLAKATFDIAHNERSFTNA